jgi:hypothetical protein
MCDNKPIFCEADLKKISVSDQIVDKEVDSAGIEGVYKVYESHDNEIPKDFVCTVEKKSGELLIDQSMRKILTFLFIKVHQDNEKLNQKILVIKNIPKTISSADHYRKLSN